MSSIAREAFASVGLTASDSVDMMKDVEAFHEKYQHARGPTPRVLPTDLFKFRHGFHLEEIKEYEGEQEVLEEERIHEDYHEPEVVIEALSNQLDALCDAAWVILGTAELQFGRARFHAAWRRVVAANMSKVLAGEVEGSVDSGRNKKFDIVKPPGWVAPDHKDLVSDYHWGE